MSAWQRLLGKRPYALCLAGGLLALLAGDRAQLAPPPGVGIDPFEVLDQQVRNNVLIILDTSGSMKWPSDRDDFTLGADDPASRMYQAKQAIKAVVTANQNRVNFGLMSYNILSSGKTLNKGQDFEGDGRADGPFIYVSADANAAQFYTAFSNLDDAATGGENEACTTIDGFFCHVSSTFANYDGANSGDVWRSFMNRNGTTQTLAYNDPYPAGCTVGAGQLSPVDLSAPAAMRCRFYMQSRLIRNGVKFTWNRASTNVTTRLTATAAITCPAPPAGLVGWTATNPICVQMADSVTGNTATFYYTSAIYENQSGNACGGGALLTQVAACTANNAPLVLANMDPELPVDPTGQLVSVPAPPGNATFDFGDGHLDGDQTTPAGLRADQSTPLAGSLDTIRLATGANIAFPPLPPDAPNQKNFVILVTDGDDTCANSNTDRAAVLAGVAASNLYGTGPTPGADFQHRAETLVVGFASAVNPARVNVVAQGGSGAIINAAATNPATAVTGCNPGGACRNAFFASNTQQLIDILNAALEQASASGVFSTTPSVFSGVPEYIDTLATPPPSPSPVPSPFSVMNPDRRYAGAAFRSYRASFDVAGFRGFVHGTDNFGVMTGPAARPTPSPSPSPVPSPMPVYPRNWEAGARMLDADRVSSDMATADHTFAQMMVSPSTPLPPVGTNTNSAAAVASHIHRRIFTTRQNGRRLARIGTTPAADDLSGSTICAGGPCRVNLWPPSDTVAPGPPTYDYTGTTWRTPGILDTRLFRKDDGTQMTLADLQGSPLFACKGTNLPAGCLTTASAADQLSASQKEAREMILAFTAGAAPQRDAQGFPARTTAGLINYRRRSWLLSESTVGSPALVTPPRQQPPTLHTSEYLLYRDGPRDNAGTAVGTSDLFIRQGFGLRNPDRDGKETPAGALSRPNVKPVMSVVYVPANDMLHAFRAGPCPNVPSVTTCGTGISPAGNQETGGEELWAFVPHDLLPHLKDKMKVQTRTDHTFMISTSLRTADVFVPGVATLTFGSKSYAVNGRWRRIMYFGRGLGGKYYTALDITGVGSVTAATLDTELPGVLWNRGNPDTQDGLGTGPINNTASDATLYLDMGQTWSTPSLTRVTPNTVNGSREFLLFTGSGYSTGAANEGTRFYALDPISGDVVYSGDVGQGLQPAFRNALVASPIAYAAGQFVAGVNLPHPGTSPADSVFIGDIHGRLWKFDLTSATTPGTPILFRNLGPDEPIAVEAGLLNLSGKANVYVETGFDARLTTGPAQGWALYGFRDDGPTYPASAVIVPTAGPPTFAQAFGTPPPAGKGDWRGTLGPVTGFVTLAGVASPAVVFTGTRFNPIAAGRCISTFDTILVSLNGTNGANYWSRSWDDVRAQGVPTIPPADPGPTSPPPVDTSKGTASGGTGPANMPADKTTIPATAKATTIHPGSTVCR